MTRLQQEVARKVHSIGCASEYKNESNILNITLDDQSICRLHERLHYALSNIQGKFLLSYNDCEWVRETYKDFQIFDFSRVHSMVQRYDAGKQFPELLIGNYDLFERERNKPFQMTLFSDEEDFNHLKILKECILQCKVKL